MMTTPISLPQISWAARVYARTRGNHRPCFTVQHAMSHEKMLPNRASIPRRACPALALAALIAACNTAGTATPQPTNQPSSPAATPAGPTPTPSPSPSPTFNSDQIQHPTGANDARPAHGNRAAASCRLASCSPRRPRSRLYGDGTVIFQQIDNCAAPRSAPPICRGSTAKMDEDGIQALLRFALSTGRLANARDNYENPMVADAGTTIFNLNAAGMEKVVNVYALGLEGQPGVDQADRQGFAQLSTVLSDFQNQEGLGEVERVRAVVLQGLPDGGLWRRARRPSCRVALGRLDRW